MRARRKNREKSERERRRGKRHERKTGKADRGGMTGETRAEETASERRTEKKAIVDDMFLLRDRVCSGGLPAMRKYVSPIEADVATLFREAGYSKIEKIGCGAYGLDLTGETPLDAQAGGNADCPLREAMKDETALFAACLDANGAPRRAAATSGLVALKPTYGAVSRYGIYSAASSGDVAGFVARDAKACATAYGIAARHSDRDGTSEPDEAGTRRAKAERARGIARVVVLDDFLDGVDAATRNRIAEFEAGLNAAGIKTERATCRLIRMSNIPWNVILCAETRANLAKIDGMRFGECPERHSSVDEAYETERTNGFPAMIKCAIAYGAFALESDRYAARFDRALRLRRLVRNEFDRLFETFDAAVLPACSKAAYSESDYASLSPFCENAYSAPASITGLPALVARGVQTIGRMRADEALLDYCERCEAMQ